MVVMCGVSFWGCSGDDEVDGTDWEDWSVDGGGEGRREAR